MVFGGLGGFDGFDPIDCVERKAINDDSDFKIIKFINQFLLKQADFVTINHEDHCLIFGPKFINLICFKPSSETLEIKLMA